MPGNDRYSPRFVRPLPTPGQPASTSGQPAPYVPLWVSIWLVVLVMRSCAQGHEIAELRQECAERGP